LPLELQRRLERAEISGTRAGDLHARRHQLAALLQAQQLQPIIAQQPDLGPTQLKRDSGTLATLDKRAVRVQGAFGHTRRDKQQKRHCDRSE